MVVLNTDTYIGMLTNSNLSPEPRCGMWFRRIEELAALDTNIEIPDRNLSRGHSRKSLDHLLPRRTEDEPSDFQRVRLVSEKQMANHKQYDDSPFARSTKQVIDTLQITWVEASIPLPGTFAHGLKVVQTTSKIYSPLYGLGLYQTESTTVRITKWDNNCKLFREVEVDDFFPQVRLKELERLLNEMSEVLL